MATEVATAAAAPDQVRARPDPIHRSLTFGVLGENSKQYPSAQWQSESHGHYGSLDLEDKGKARETFLITTLDTRHHNPQSRQAFHIRRINKKQEPLDWIVPRQENSPLPPLHPHPATAPRIINIPKSPYNTSLTANKKPVCTVHTWMEDKQIGNGEPVSVYMSSFQDRAREPRKLIVRNKMERVQDAIVPVDHARKDFDIRAEMLLPVCDSTMISSTTNPHRYLLRKRKVPPTRTACGVIYSHFENPNFVQHTRSLPGQNLELPRGHPERVSVSSLTGHNFSRRKFIQPPGGHIHNGFNGAVPATTSHRFDDKYLPFVRSKSII